MSVIWALVANSSYAQIYEIKGHGKEINEIRLYDNPDGRKKNGDFNTDKPGRTFDSLGGGRHAYSTHNDPHTQEVLTFALKLTKDLEKAKNEKLFDELAFIAPSHFIGALHESLQDNVKKSVIKEVHKDLPQTVKGKERLALLADYLDLWNR